MRYRTEVEIAAPAAEVWAVVADVPGWPRWTPTVRSAELLDAPALALGARVRLRQPRLPVLVWTVDALDPGRSFSWSTGPRLARTTAVHTVHELGPGRCRVELVFAQAGLAAVLGAVTAGTTRRYVDAEAAGLARFCAGTGLHDVDR